MEFKSFNGIFKGTALEKLPIDFSWSKERPTYIYDVSDDKITISIYEGWVPYEETQNDIYYQGYFIHDICHLLLYTHRKEWTKLFKSNFGLTWDNVIQSEDRSKIPDLFLDVDEYIDELKIVTLQYAIGGIINDKEALSKEELYEVVSKNTDHFVTRDANRKLEVTNFIDYLYEIGTEKFLKQTTTELAKRLKSYQSLFGD